MDARPADATADWSVELAHASDDLAGHGTGPGGVWKDADSSKRATGGASADDITLNIASGGSEIVEGSEGISF